jgi:hypothetical protein
MQPTPAKSILSSLSSSSRRSRLLHGAAPAPSETTTTCATSGDVADTSTMDDEDDHDGHHNDNRKPPSSDDVADTSTMHDSILLLKDHTQPPVGRMGAIESTPSQDAVDEESMIDNNHQADDMEDEDNHDADHHLDNRKPPGSITTTNSVLVDDGEDDEQEDFLFSNEDDISDVESPVHEYHGSPYDLPPLAVPAVDDDEDDDHDSSLSQDDAPLNEEHEDLDSLFTDKAQIGQNYDTSKQEQGTNRNVEDEDIPLPQYSGREKWHFYSNQVRAYLDLMFILDSMNCPQNAFEVILNKWVKKHCPVGKETADFDPQKKHPTRKKLLRDFRTQLGLSQEAEAIPVPLEHDAQDRHTPQMMKKTIVYRFSFEEQLLGVLNNPAYMRIPNMVVNKNDPFSRYIAQEKVDEIQDAWIYQTLLDTLEGSINHAKIFVIGLILYVDKTHSDGKGRFCLEPVIAYLTILNEETRAQFGAQIILGYINDLELSSSAYKRTTVDPKCMNLAISNL